MKTYIVKGKRYIVQTQVRNVAGVAGLILIEYQTKPVLVQGLRPGIEVKGSGDQDQEDIKILHVYVLTPELQHT